MEKLLNVFLEDWLSSVVVVLLAAGSISFYRKFILNPKKIDVNKSLWSRQLLLTGIVFCYLVVLLLALPISEGMKGQLFNLIGIAITATIALSSTTFVGNTMAGLMLRAVNSVRPGDFLKVGDHMGRVSEQGLLHTEIQTEDRDLTTLPNLFLVTNPVTVVRYSGTMISATISLGYDVPRKTIEELLIVAAERAELKDPFVQVLELGDFSVTYRVAGFLDEVKYLISYRSKLRCHMLDVLHENNIEIVSPNFVNQRVFPIEKTFIPRKVYTKEKEEPLNRSPEDVIFDKAEEAESKEKIKEFINKNNEQLQLAKEALEKDPENLELQAQFAKYEKRSVYLLEILSKREEADK